MRRDQVHVVSSSEEVLALGVDAGFLAATFFVGVFEEVLAIVVGLVNYVRKLRGLCGEDKGLN